MRDVAQSESSWSKPYSVAAEEGLAHWNPVLLFVPKRHTIPLFYKVGSPISSRYTRTIESKDGDETWGPPRELVPGDRGAYDDYLL
jgi:predicted neuraminidase